MKAVPGLKFKNYFANRKIWGQSLRRIQMLENPRAVSHYRKMFNSNSIGLMTDIRNGVYNMYIQSPPLVITPPLTSNPAIRP